MEAILAAMFKEKPWKAYFWEQSTLPFPWNLYWTDVAREGRGVDIKNPVFGQYWTRDLGAHSWFPCDPEEPCDCEEHNNTGIHSTV